MTRARAAIAGVALAASALAGCSGKDDVSNDERNLPISCATAAAVDAAARRAAAAAAPEMPATFSPILPIDWPPQGQPTAVIFGYVRTVLPTSTARWEVHAPFVRIDVALTGDSAVPRATRLEARTLGSERGGASTVSADAMEQAAEALLVAICQRRVPAAADAVRVRAAYRQWIVEHTVIADELRTTVPAFFSWLEQEG